MEERFEQFVEEASALERRPDVFVFRLLVHLQHVSHVELEGTLQVPLEPADADPWQHPRPGLAFEARAGAIGTGGAHPRPTVDGRGKVRPYICCLWGQTFRFARGSFPVHRGQRFVRKHLHRRIQG